MFNKTKYKYIFLRKEYSTMNVATILVTKIAKTQIKLNEKTYIVNLNEPNYNFRNEKIYLIDIESGSQISFNVNNSLLKPDELDRIIGNKLLEDITRGLFANVKEKILWVVMGLIMGALIAFMIMMFVMQNKIDEIYASMNQTIIMQ